MKLNKFIKDLGIILTIIFLSIGYGFFFSAMLGRTDGYARTTLTMLSFIGIYFYYATTEIVKKINELVEAINQNEKKIKEINTGVIEE